MQKIRFTYKSSEVQPSVFLLLYFRMTGIYVYERFFDFGLEGRERLLRVLPEENRKSDLGDDFDLDLFIVSDRADWEAYLNQYEAYEPQYLPGRIVVFSENCGISLPYKEETVYYREYMWKKIQSEQKLLDDIIGQMRSMEVISQDAWKDLNFCRQIYAQNEIQKLSLLGKFFYVAEEDKQYTDIKNNYQMAVENIFKVLRVNECKWGDGKFIHLQYAALNMAYEGDLYCIRNGKQLIYAPKSLVSVCRLLMEDQEVLGGLEDSFYLLLAQIYDDLLMDANMAYKYYLLVCKEYNAYAYYRKGNYWQNFGKDSKKAIIYYEKSLSIYPEYYRAWYRLGMCYALEGRSDSALGAFRNIWRLLKPRLEAKRVRAMEIEYLFKAQNQCANICKKEMNNHQQAIREDLKIVEIWNAINTSTFFDLFAPNQNQIRQRVRNQLNVSKIYYDIYFLADMIGDVQLKEEYLDKIVGN